MELRARFPKRNGASSEARPVMFGDATVRYLVCTAADACALTIFPLSSPLELFAVLTTTEPSPLRIAFAWSSVRIVRPNLPDTHVVQRLAAATGAAPAATVTWMSALVTALDRFE